MKTETFTNGDNVTFGRLSVGVYRGQNRQGMAQVEIGIDGKGEKLVAIVPEDELTKED